MKTTTLALMRSAMLTLLATILSTTIVSKAQTPTGKSRLRVASYNIQHGMGMDGRLDYLRTARVLEKINADVVAVQEVDSMTRRTGHTYALGEIADAMRYYASYAAAIDFDGGRYGIGILSRQRPLRIERRALPGREEARAIIVAEFKDYVFAATHLSLTEEDRMASLAIITEIARASRKPFIIAGDMNAEPGSTFIGELEKDFHICSKNAKSWPADKPQACLDYIAAYKSYGDVKRPGADDEWANYRPYVGEPAVTLNAQVVNTQASDHRPIYADIVLPTPTAQLLTTQPYLQLATRTSMNVMFQTNCVGHCWIEYGTDTLNTRRARTLVDGQEVCYDIENNIKLDHLQPGTRYYYRVCVQEILHKSAYANHFGGDTLRTRFYSLRNFYSAGMHSLIGYYGDKTYAAFTWGKTRFVMLDPGEDKPDSTPVYGGLNDFTQLRMDQTEFIKHELKSKEFKQARHRVLISHIPIFGNTDKYRPCTEMWGGMLAKAPFDLGIGAHTHTARLHRQGVDGCGFPVYIGGGYKMDSATVAVLTCREGRLSLKVLGDNDNNQWTLDLGR